MAGCWNIIAMSTQNGPSLSVIQPGNILSIYFDTVAADADTGCRQQAQYRHGRHGLAATGFTYESGGTACIDTETDVVHQR